MLFHLLDAQVTWFGVVWVRRSQLVWDEISSESNLVTTCCISSWWEIDPCKIISVFSETSDMVFEFDNAYNEKRISVGSVKSFIFFYVKNEIAF